MALVLALLVPISLATYSLPVVLIRVLRPALAIVNSLKLSEVRWTDEKRLHIDGTRGYQARQSLWGPL